MGILLKKVRIHGFRGLLNFEMDLEPITVITGTNNAGKTSFLKALQIVFGNISFLSKEDFSIINETINEKIIIDVLIISVDDKFNQVNNFSEEWETLFTAEKITIDATGKQSINLRTCVTIDNLKNAIKTKQYIQDEWVDFKDAAGLNWYETENGVEKTFFYENTPFFYINADRDIIEDIKLKSSYLGKLLSNIEYAPADILSIEAQIKALNEQAVNSSDILSRIEASLKELDTAMDNVNNGVNISPFPKKVRDLNKGISIQYSDFSMEYHGMGTRSWSSLLTLKSFVTQFSQALEGLGEPFYPLVAIEEPEAHLHPNAQKKLYSQIASIPGQKIISTHSSYIAASASLNEIRNLYKNNEEVKCGKIDISLLEKEELRKINRQVINTRGELFFSKVIVFFEGETEEQALPVFAEKYFGKLFSELGIDFVGINGFGNYFPFIYFAEKLNIKWFVLSDGEKDVIKKIEKVLKSIYSKEEIKLSDYENVLILEKEYDFEKYLINCGYKDEIIKTFELLYGEGFIENFIKKRDGSVAKKIQTKEVCDKCEQNIYENVLRDYSGNEGFLDALNDAMSDNKTQYAPILAELIIESELGIPPIIIELFEKIGEFIFNKPEDEK